MKKSLLIAFLYGGMVAAQNKDYAIQPVSITHIKLTDQFWSPKIETNRTVTIPASFARCENTGRVKNFEMAAAKSGKFCTVYPFDDTDIYKTIEGASYSMAVHPDTKLDHYVDSMITIVGKAQEPDGYLYTARTIDPIHPHKWAGPERWVNENNMSHELYNSGHMFEAAAAHYQATGKRNFLNIALKNADLLVQTFGPGKRHVAPGHEIVEMGLVRLYRITGKKDYLDLAKFFIDERGKRTYDKNSTDPFKNGVYWQDDEPVTAQDEAEGHAVRAMYLYAGMTDVAALTGNKEYIAAVDKIWDNMVSKKIYVQGGVGALGDGERFGANYQLPNATAYNETCAAVGNVYWNQRMFLLHGESKYIDLMEKVLYNGLISGVGLDGKSFFYTNAMQIQNNNTHKDREAGRSGWFECSCCPTNLARLLPSIPGYIFAQKDNAVFINLFVSSKADLLIDNKMVNVSQQNNYPWNGLLNFTVSPATAQNFEVKIRIPGWVKNEAIPSDLYSFQHKETAVVVIKVNGKPVKYAMQNGYAVIGKVWQKNDQITMDLPMPVRKVISNNIIAEDAGKVALQRGPLMYCAEWTDNNGQVSNIVIPKNTVFTPAYHQELLNGLTVLNGQVLKTDSADKSKTQTVALTAIPYYSWANRGKGEMQVWFTEAGMTAVSEKKTIR
ncbi:MAG: glycoside hydrolase family 127 protein [Janthinobacterium lividum]